MDINAIWITHISDYKNTKNAFATAEQIMNIKNQRREILLKKYNKLIPGVRLINCRDNRSIMLAEGRAAKLFWRNFALLLPKWCNFRHRYPKSDDMVNQLLDIGYHHITVLVNNILKKYKVSPVLGILHVAQKSTSTPLAYDLVEMFRADIVEAEVLRFFRMKKKVQERLHRKDIPIFLYRLNRRLNHKYFVKSFKQCHTYAYYMELQVLRFISAVNHKDIFSPLHLPIRHDMRCVR